MLKNSSQDSIKNSSQDSIPVTPVTICYHLLPPIGYYPSNHVGSPATGSSGAGSFVVHFSWPGAGHGSSEVLGWLQWAGKFIWNSVAWSDPGNFKSHTNIWTYGRYMKQIYMIHSNKSHHQREIWNTQWKLNGGPRIREKRRHLWKSPKKITANSKFHRRCKNRESGKKPRITQEYPRNFLDFFWCQILDFFFWNYSKIFHFFPRNFPDSWFLGFLVSRFLGFSVSRFLGFSVSRFLGFSVSRFLGFSVSRFLGFSVSRFFGFSSP